MNSANVLNWMWRVRSISIQRKIANLHKQTINYKPNDQKNREICRNFRRFGSERNATKRL